MMRRFEIRALAALLALSPAALAQTPTQNPATQPPAGGVPDATPGAPAAPAPATSPAAAGPAATAPAPAAPASATEAAADTTPGARKTAFRKRARLAAPSPSTAEPPAAGAEPVDHVEPTPNVPAAPIPFLSGWLGVGSLWLPSDGLDPFAEDDALVMFSAGAALSLVGGDGINVAAVAGWDATASEAELRGDASSLGLMRFALGPELRGSIIDRLFWHGRLSPTLTRLSTELEESSSGATLSDQQWVWGAEATVGLDFRFTETPTTLPSALGFFVRLEGGYAWSPSSSISLAPDGSDAPVRTQPLELRELALAGPSFRASVGAGF